MKKIILLFMMLAGLTMSAQKCKYAKNEVDKFTNKTIVETKEDAFVISGMGLGFSVGYSLYKSDNNKYLKLRLTDSGSLFAIREGNEIMFKLENGNVINLKFIESQIADSSYNSGLKATFHKIITLVPITNEEIDQFKNNKLTDIRIYTTDGYVDKEVKEKRAKIFQELLKCI